MSDQSRKLWMLPNGNPVTQMHNGRYEEFERYGNRSGPNVLTGAVYHDELPDCAVEYTPRPDPLPHYPNGGGSRVVNKIAGTSCARCGEAVEEGQYVRLEALGDVYHDGCPKTEHRPPIEPAIVPMPAPRNDGNALALRILADMLDEEPDNADVLRDAYVRIHRATS